jgi:acyl-CoA reductase-like NAD-dependent aldehyde dehydrogenase
MDDADLDEASTLAVQGSYKNSGQRCTAVKRMLVHARWPAASPSWWWTRPGLDLRRPVRPKTEMGTVIDEAAAKALSARERGHGQGARLLAGNQRDGALYAPTVIDRVTRDDWWCTRKPSARCRPSSRFGIDEAIRISNGTAYGLSSSVCTNRLDYITRFVSELHVGTVNVREVPGYRPWSSRPSAASRTRAWATRKACRKR